jgi:hypothetical protein
MVAPIWKQADQMKVNWFGRFFTALGRAFLVRQDGLDV